MVPPGARSPRRSASSIIALPIRSLTEPPGLNHSSLAKIRAAPREKRGSSTNGVWPIASSRARPRWIAVADGALNGSCFLPDDSKKKPRRIAGASKNRWNGSVRLLRAACRVALAAVDGLAVGRVEGNLRLLSAAVAGHVVERALPSLARGGLPLVAAGLAALGLVGEAFARVELLIIGGEKERAAAIDASEVLIRVLLHHGSNRSPGFSPRDLLPVKKVAETES